MHVVILSRSKNRSPLVLAQSLKSQLENCGCRVTLVGDADGLLRRILPLSELPIRWSNRLHYRIRQKLLNFFRDRKSINMMKTADAVILSECIPNAFWKNYYDIETLRKLLGPIPIGFLEVFFLRGAPVLRQRLEFDGDHLEDRYDFHLGVSVISYVKHKPSNNEFAVGLALDAISGLNSTQRKEFHVLVDFVYPGNEDLLNHQCQVLKAHCIPFTVLQGEYSFEEIRKLYRQSAVLLIQHPESFGLPIAECLACGCMIMTPHSAWPMAFRIEESPTPVNENPVRTNGELQDYGHGILPPELFRIFEGKQAFENSIVALRAEYDQDFTPQNTARTFRSIYPQFCVGDNQEVQRLCTLLRRSDLEAI
jgi:hypothetical protein